MKISSSIPINFSTQPYTTEDLSISNHSKELEYFPRPFTSLNLDPYLMGIGGDDSWSASVHEEFLLPPSQYSFDLTFNFYKC
jgi:beta-galactosidase